MYGNQDSNKLFKFDSKYAGMVVVRHYNTETMSSGAKVEDPKSSRYQFYEPETWDDLTFQPIIDGKQVKSKIEAIGLNYEVLHDPKK